MFRDVQYRTLSGWPRTRCLLGKGANPRFVVTSLARKRLETQALYGDFYCARGDMENRVKKQHTDDLFADRTSAAGKGRC